MIASYWRGIGLALTAAVLWGASAPVTKLIALSGVSPLSVVIYRCLISVLAIGAWLCVKREFQRFHPSARVFKTYVALAFLTIVCMSGGFMLACVYLTVPQVVILHYTFPLLTLAGDAWITRERPRIIQVFAALMIFLGVYVGFDVGGQGIAGISIVGVAWALLSAVGFAGQNLLVRSAAKEGEFDLFGQIFFVHLLGGIMLVLGKSIFGSWGDLLYISPGVFLLMQYMAIVSGLIGFVLLFLSLKYISATAASLICTLEIVGALALSPILLGGGSTVKELIGSAIILAAVICSTLGKR